MNTGIAISENEFAGISRHEKKRYWQARELTVIGVFAALVKTVTLLIALTGGGMNPLSLVLKNMAATTLVLVLLSKVPKFGTLTLFALVCSLVSLLLNGSGIFTLPGTMAGGILGDCFLYLRKEGKTVFVAVAGVAVFDFASRVISILLSVIAFRETPQLVVMGTVIAAIGYIGCLAGLFSGIYLVKELKHAGIIQQ